MIDPPAPESLGCSGATPRTAHCCPCHTLPCTDKPTHSFTSPDPHFQLKPGEIRQERPEMEVLITLQGRAAPALACPGGWGMKNHPGLGTREIRDGHRHPKRHQGFSNRKNPKGIKGKNIPWLWMVALRRGKKNTYKIFHFHHITKNLRAIIVGKGCAGPGHSPSCPTAGQGQL